MIVDAEMLREPKCQACGNKANALVSILGKFCCGNCVLKIKAEKQKQNNKIFDIIKG